MPYILERDLECIRAELPITRHRKFFNTGWAGPECRAGMAAQGAMTAWLNRTGLAHHSMPRIRALTERVRAKAAALVGADAESVVLTRGTVDAMNIVLTGYTWQAGDHVVTTSLEHSGGLVPLYVLRDRFGVEVTIAPLDDLQDMAGRIAAACTARTRLILLSHASYNTGARLPLEAVVERAHGRGIRVLVDGAQTVGAIPVDVGALGADFYAFPGHKWLLGPECTGALYLGPGAGEDLEISHAGYDTAERFDRAGAYVARPGPRRFEGIDQDPVALAGWEAALDFVGAVGVPAIAARLRTLTGRLHAALQDGAGFRVVTPPCFPDAAGLVGVALDEPARARGVVEALLAEGYVIRHTPEPVMLRISVNFFNTTEEVDGLARALRAAVAGAAAVSTAPMAKPRGSCGTTRPSLPWDV